MVSAVSNSNVLSLLLWAPPLPPLPQSVMRKLVSTATQYLVACLSSTNIWWDTHSFRLKELEYIWHCGVCEFDTWGKLYFHEVHSVLKLYVVVHNCSKPFILTKAVFLLKIFEMSKRQPATTFLNGAVLIRQSPLFSESILKFGNATIKKSKKSHQLCHALLWYMWEKTFGFRHG